MTMNGINLSSNTRKIILSKKIDFTVFLKWFKENKDKINNEIHLIQSEENFKRYFNNPNENIYVLLYFFNKNH